MVKYSPSLYMQSLFNLYRIDQVFLIASWCINYDFLSCSYEHDIVLYL